MTGTGMPIMPAAATDAGFAAQQPYGAPGMPYLMPLSKTDPTQSSVSQYMVVLLLVAIHLDLLLECKLHEHRHHSVLAHSQ